MITKQLESIKERAKDSEEGFIEVAIWLQDEEESINFIVDNKAFKYDLDDTFLFVEYEGGSIDDPIIYSHVVRLARIDRITDEV